MTETVYRIFSGDELLYVGCSMYGAQRLQQHASDKPWWGDATRVTLEHFDTRVDALAAEAAAIAAENPRHNLDPGRPRGRRREAAVPLSERTTYTVRLKQCTNCFADGQSIEVPKGELRDIFLRSYPCKKCGCKMWGRTAANTSAPLRATA